jgi:hypothetical protein
MNHHVTTHAYHEWLPLRRSPLRLTSGRKRNVQPVLGHEFQTQVERACTLCDETRRPLNQFPPDFNFADCLQKYSQFTQMVTIAWRYARIAFRAAARDACFCR